MSDIDFPLWSGSDLVNAVHGVGPADWQARGISIDTRTLKPGDLFIALRGPKSDGHDFINSAWALGASAVLAENVPPLYNPRQPTVVVSDTLHALVDLAKAARERFQGRILAITGSVGKTTVKDGLSSVLSQQGRTSASANSLNNHFGVPLSLARLPQDAAFGVIEVGMNHAGEIASLIPMVAPDCALITQVSYQHGAFFADIHGIVQAKAEIFSHHPRIGILPRDSVHYDALRHSAPGVSHWITFGQHPEATVRLLDAQVEESGRRIRLSIHGQIWSYYWPQPGDHTLYNSLAIVAGALSLGACMDDVMRDLSNIQPSLGRGNIRMIRGIRIVDESYNAAPASMHAALNTFAVAAEHIKEYPSGKRYILLGEMKELGEQSHHHHAALVPYIQACKADGVWLCGTAFTPFLQDISELKGHAPDISRIIPNILETLEPGDQILIKGANSMRTFALIHALEAL